MSDAAVKLTMSEYDAQVCLSFSRAAVDAAQSLPEEAGAALMRACSAGHYEAAGIDQIIEGYIGNVRGLAEFMEREWGWIVSLDEENGVLTADENKPYCVCPLVRFGEVKNPLLCHCSEGFSRRMMEKVLQREVRSCVLKSVLRGDKSCVYEIRWQT